MPDADRLTRLPSDLLARAPEEGARLVALALTARAEAARRRLAEPDDPEALHDFRVAVRRLRSTLAAYKPELAGGVGKREARRPRARRPQPAYSASISAAYLRSIGLRLSFMVGVSSSPPGSQSPWTMANARSASPTASRLRRAIASMSLA